MKFIQEVLLFAMGMQSAQAAISYTPQDAATMVAKLISLTGGATTSNEVLTGDPVCAGIFINGQDAVPNLNPPFPDEGVVISSGDPAFLNNQDSDSMSRSYGLAGDSDLDNIVSGSTHDACALEFDFECPVGSVGSSTVSFKYSFGSDEYNEWVDSPYNDVFAWFLNGNNIALIPGTNTPVTIDTVNNGDNSQYYNDNDFWDTGSPFPYPNMEADGFTDTLTASGPTILGTNHMKLVIADRGDWIYDSWALIEGGSFDCNAPPDAVCQDLTRSADANCVANAAAAEFDGGSTDPDNDPLSFSVDPVGPYALGPTDVVLTVSDGALSDTCSATITVVDDTPPVIICPGDITQDNDPGLCSAVVIYDDVTATDNCDNDMTPTQTAGLPSGSAFPVDTTTNTWTVSDDAGNSNSCNFDVTVNDVEPPTAECAPSVNPAGNKPKANNQDGFYTILGEDNCSEADDITPAVMDCGLDGEDGTADDYEFQVNGGFNIEDVFKYVEAPGATPNEKDGTGKVDWKLTGKGDAYLILTDEYDNASEISWCRVAPPPVRRLRGMEE